MDKSRACRGEVAQAEGTRDRGIARVDIAGVTVAGVLLHHQLGIGNHHVGPRGERLQRAAHCCAVEVASPVAIISVGRVLAALKARNAVLRWDLWAI